MAPHDYVLVKPKVIAHLGRFYANWGIQRIVIHRDVWLQSLDRIEAFVPHKPKKFRRNLVWARVFLSKCISFSLMTIQTYCGWTGFKLWSAALILLRVVPVMSLIKGKQQRVMRLWSGRSFSFSGNAHLCISFTSEHCACKYVPHGRENDSPHKHILHPVICTI